MERFYIFKDGNQQGSTVTKEQAVDFIRQYQAQENHPLLRGSYSIIHGEEEFIPYPNQREQVNHPAREPSLRENAGYKIINNLHIGDAEFVIGENLAAPNPYVTWEVEHGDYYFWGHYCDTKLEAEKDLLDRAGSTLESIMRRIAQQKAAFELEIFSDGTAAICHYTGPGGYIDIPAEIDGHKIVGIDFQAFADCAGLTSVSLPDTVKYIGEEAFIGCTSLESIRIPDGVVEMGWRAFQDCKNLESVDIPKGMTSIGKSVFDGCTGLKSVSIPEGVTIIGDAFRGCTSLNNVVIPSRVIVISNYAFKDCSNLENITIPENGIEIGDYAFEGCPCESFLENDMEDEDDYEMEM